MGIGFVTGGGFEAGEEDDLSDITHYTHDASGSDATTIFDVTGSGVILGGVLLSDFDKGETSSINLTIDGTTTDISGGHVDWSVDSYSMTQIPTVKFESDAKLYVDSREFGLNVWVKQ